jgi:hypothetical protein
MQAAALGSYGVLNTIRIRGSQAMAYDIECDRQQTPSLTMDANPMVGKEQPLARFFLWHVASDTRRIRFRNRTPAGHEMPPCRSMRLQFGTVTAVVIEAVTQETFFIIMVCIRSGGRMRIVACNTIKPCKVRIARRGVTDLRLCKARAHRHSHW